MSKEEIFKQWLKDKPMANIIVTTNAQMGYILEFAEYYHKEKIKWLEEQVKQKDIAIDFLTQELSICK